MKQALFTLVLLLGGVAAASPAADVDALVATLRDAAPGQPRLDAAAKLAAMPSGAQAALAAKLKQPRTTSTDVDRRAVLARFKADMPGPNGQFKSPGRPPKGGPPPDPDWLAELAKMEGNEPALLDSLETVALIRALAAGKQELGADAILELAFDAEGMTFRDECGRYLRAMSPHSLPTLLRATQDKKRAGGSYGRYATYQLDRLDKSRPSYVLDAAGSDELEAAVLRAIGDVKHPDAVQAVLERTDAPSHAIRRAAREAWMAYVTGPAPPPAPKAKRKLPGGKMTDEELPLYLTYRELAFNDVTRKLTQLTGGPPDPKLDAEALTKILFALFDERRTALWDDAMKQAAALASEAKWDQVERAYDAILTDDPTYARRADMVAGYLEAGKAHLASERWDAATAAFHKARAIDPAGARGREAEAQLHYARALRAQAAGLGGDDELARALEADPGLPEARDAAAEKARAGARAASGWMMYAGIGSGVLALFFVVWVVIARRHAGAR